MDIKKAELILGDRSIWELENMKKALTMFPVLNSPEENERLEAVKVMLKNKKVKKLARITAYKTFDFDAELDSKLTYHEKKRKLWEDSLDSLLDVKAVLKQEKGK